MRKSQMIQLEQSELREAVNDALSKDKLTDPEREEMETKTKRLQQTEGELRAAITIEAAEDAELRNEFNDDPETRELRGLETRANVGAYVASAMSGGRVGGAELEYNQALNLSEDRFPLRLLAPGQEQRATTAVDAATQQTRWVDRLFAEACAMKLGFTFDSVAPGVAAYPVTTGGATPAQRGKAQLTADAGWAVGVTELKPTRNAVRAVFTVEDAARLPTLEEALTRELRMALVEGVDRAIFIGDATADPDAGDIVGLTTASIDESTITQANKVKWPETVAVFASLIDGKYAMGPADLNIVAAVGANTLWMSTSANTNRNESVAQVLQGNGLTWKTRGDIEAATTSGTFGAFVGLARGIAGAGVAAVWDSSQLLRDPYSNSAKGEVALTMNHLWATGLPRTANFKRVKFA